jgi:membrane fusion protein, multidrug efflux system
MNAVTKIPEDAAAAAAPAQPMPKRRGVRIPRFFLMALLPLLLVAGGVFYWLSSGRYEETENASYRQAKVTIASDISGRVTSSNVADNAQVRRGDLLFTIEPEPYQIALSLADAELQSAKLKVEQLRASYREAVAQQKAVEDEIAYLETELKRQESLLSKGVSTQTSAEDARHALIKARDQLEGLRHSVASSLAALGGNPDAPVDTHPSVMEAMAARDKAAYNLSLTKVVAPANGVLYQAASFQRGQFVSAGTPLFTLVEADGGWVEANFKETQLTNIKPGQKAEIVVDAFPGRKLQATVEAVGAGTGNEFSLLPAQNATGNWVKVTQRIPVTLRIAEDTSGMMLRSGLSASVAIDTGQKRDLAGLLPFAHAAQ